MDEAEAAARWGRWATAVAVVIPVLTPRPVGMGAGHPPGMSEEFLREGQEAGLWIAGAALATLGIAGAVLTLGSCSAGARSSPAGSRG